MSDRYIHSIISWCHVSYTLVSYSATKTVAQNTLGIIHLFNTASAHQLIWKSCNSAPWKRIFPEMKYIPRRNEILPAETKYSPWKWNVKIFASPPPTPKYSSQPKDIPRGKNLPRCKIIPRSPENIPRRKIFPAAQKLFRPDQKIFPVEKDIPRGPENIPRGPENIPHGKNIPRGPENIPRRKKYSFLCPPRFPYYIHNWSLQNSVVFIS